MIDDDDESTSKTAESAYDTMLDLFENPEPSQAWVDEFNKAAKALENRCDDGIDDSLPTTNHVLPWIAWLEEGRIYIASPPIILKGSSIRLTLDVMNPLRDIHINVHAIPCNEKGEMLDKMSNANTACLIISPDAGPAMIFAGWDYVAREGIEEALRTGAIVQSWVQVVTAKVPCLDLSTIEEQHAMKMLEVYASDGDLDRAIVEYRKVNKSNSYRCSVMAVKYNKIRFHLAIEGEGNEPTNIIEIEQVRLNKARLSKKAYAKWILNGVQLTRETLLKMFADAENEMYPDRKTLLNARYARNGDVKAVVNARAPGDALPNALFPEEFAFVPVVPLVTDESTNRTDAVRSALKKIGRGDGFDGKHLKDADGVVCAEIKVGMNMKDSGAVFTKFKGVIVDKVRIKAQRYEYQSCLKDGGFGFLKGDTSFRRRGFVV